MIALHILEVKEFMNKLLLENIFDHFLLQEATILSDLTVTIDGTLTPDFYSSDELEAYGLMGLSFLPFGRLRTRCFDLIKGKRTPAGFKFIFLLSPDNLARTLTQTHSSFLPSDITAMYLNLKFSGGELQVTNGISYRIFSVDKSLEQEWDSLVKRFLKKNGIAFEEK